MTKIVDVPAVMEQQDNEGTGLIQVKQIPIIIEKLASVKEQVLEKTTAATQMVCTEENYKEIKKLRTTLKKEYEEWEGQRKNVKYVVLTPYDQFEATYKDCISAPYKTADKELKAKIDSVEDGLKEQKKASVVAYFNEYAQSLGIDFVAFENVGCNINMTVTVKKLKEQVTTYLDKVMDDLKLISTQEHTADILVEYKRSLNVSQAITTVTERYEAIAAEKARAEAERAEREKVEQAKSENIAEYEPFIANIPEEIEAPEGENETVIEHTSVSETVADPVYPLTFTVYGTKAQLKEIASAIKEIINERGLKYE